MRHVNGTPILSRVGLRSAQAGTVRGDAPLHRFGKGLAQMEPVGDLDRAPAGSLVVVTASKIRHLTDVSR